MLSELCGYLRNYFEREKYFGDFKIVNGVILPALDQALLENQYIRIVGSVLKENNGVFQYHAAGIEGLVDEAFNGAIWSLAIPKEIIDLSAEIDAWNAKYGGADSTSMSPFSSENFGGYGYTMSTGSNGKIVGGWQNAFANRLSQWRKN